MTQKTALLLAVLAILACGTLLAATPPPAASQSPAMAAILAGPAAGAQPTFVMSCEPPTRFVCVNKQCQCGVSCGSRGVKSFTCNPSTGVSNCVCN